jgi:HJR/Mrr/RecB family endonuclease
MVLPVLAAMSSLTSQTLLQAVLVILSLIGLVGASIVWWRVHEGRRHRLRAKTLAELLALSPLQFEQAVADLLHDMGYRGVQRVGGAGDLHVDIRARDQLGKRIAVQCKRYAADQRITSPEMQTFVGMLFRYHDADRGIYVTTSTFTQPARDLARNQQIWLIDGEELTRLMTELNRTTNSDAVESTPKPAIDNTTSVTSSGPMLASDSDHTATVLTANTAMFAPVVESGRTARPGHLFLWIGAPIAASILVWTLLSRSARGGPTPTTTSGSRTASAVQVPPQSTSVRLPTRDQTQSSAPAQTPAPTAVPPPAARATSVESPRNAQASASPAPSATANDVSPTQTVRDFYAALNGRNFQAAWNLLSPEYQQTLDFNAWVSGYRTTQSVQLSSVSISAQDTRHATANVAIMATDITDTGAKTTEYQGTWELVLTDGPWELDKPTIRQV